MTLQEILEDYPQLTKDDIKASLEYVADMKGELLPVVVMSNVVFF